MDQYEQTPGGKIFNGLDAYFDADHLSEDDKKLLADLDAIDVSTAELAVEFTDIDIINNAALLGQMALKRGHANNVECNSYTYVINVYQKDALNGVHMFSRIYDFTENVAIQLIELFSSFNAHFIHRSTTESFAAANEPVVTHIEKRQVNVYDLIVPEGFDIDGIHYHYSSQIVSFEPWEQIDEHWDSVLKEDYVDFLPDNKWLKQPSTSPHKLDTRSAICHRIIK